MRVAINGFGRIGRQAFRIAWGADDVEVAHINDITDAPTLAHLLKYDTNYGVWDHEVEARDGALVIDGQSIPVTAEKDPSRLPWKERTVDVVLESTGVFRRREDGQKHLDAGAKKVLISAPGKDPLDGNFIIGVNENEYEPDRQHVISIGSCTTNCLAPMVKVLHDAFGLRRGLMTTVHAYTADQNLVDAPHKDLRRGRSAAANIAPTTTGAAKTIGKIIPELDGKLDGMAMRVPVSCGSITDLTCEVQRETSAEEINETVRREADGRLRGIVRYEEAPIVSSDVVGNPSSCIFSPEDTRVQEGTFVKVLGWYDNEWGFSTRLVEMMQRMVPEPQAAG